MNSDLIVVRVSAAHPELLWAKQNITDHRGKVSESCDHSTLLFSSERRRPRMDLEISKDLYIVSLVSDSKPTFQIPSLEQWQNITKLLLPKMWQRRNTSIDGTQPFCNKTHCWNPPSLEQWECQLGLIPSPQPAGQLLQSLSPNFTYPSRVEFHYQAHQAWYVSLPSSWVTPKRDVPLQHPCQKVHVACDNPSTPSEVSQRQGPVLNTPRAGSTQKYQISHCVAFNYAGGCA